jgi:hypothetical protein
LLHGDRGSAIARAGRSPGRSTGRAGSARQAGAAVERAVECAACACIGFQPGAGVGDEFGPGTPAGSDTRAGLRACTRIRARICA